MGGRKTGGVCVSCLEAFVSHQFLVAHKPARRGPKICVEVRKKWEVQKSKG
ncbi:unnamed protein product [Ectocarpus sp. 6 AP-2014]